MCRIWLIDHAGGCVRRIEQPAFHQGEQPEKRRRGAVRRSKQMLQTYWQSMADNFGTAYFSLHLLELAKRWRPEKRQRALYVRGLIHYDSGPLFRSRGGGLTLADFEPAAGLCIPVVLCSRHDVRFPSHHEQSFNQRYEHASSFSAFEKF